jgi:hypothetical protein
MKLATASFEHVTGDCGDDGGVFRKRKCEFVLKACFI